MTKTNTAVAAAASNVRLIEVAQTQIKTDKGIAAADWRNNVAVRMAQKVDMDAQTRTLKIKDNERSLYVVRETETSRREFSLELLERKGNNQLKPVAGAQTMIVGMFGKDLTPKPVKQKTEPHHGDAISQAMAPGVVDPLAPEAN